MPVEKAIGAHVAGATINGTGALTILAEKVGGETLLARIIALVSDAQRSRAPVQRLADRVAAVFVPVVIAVAVLDVHRLDNGRARTASCTCAAWPRWPS